MEEIAHLNWRYAVKKYLPVSINPKELQLILESIRLTPTSLGLQPFKVFVVSSPEQKQLLLPICNNQSQAKDASHLLIFAAYTNIDEEFVGNHISNIAITRNQDPEQLNGFKNGIHRFIQQQEPSELKFWTAKQTYIALGMAMTTAAHIGIDSTPMEGFNVEAMDEFLSLKDQNLSSTLVLTLGHRDPEADKLAHLPKVRKSNEELFVFL